MTMLRAFHLLLSLLPIVDSFQQHYARPQFRQHHIQRHGLLDGLVSEFQERTKEATVQHVLLSSKDAAGAVYEEIKREGPEVIGRVAQEVSECGSGKKRPEAKMAQLRGQPGELKFRRGSMAPQFEAVAFEAPLQEVQEPFQTQFGWHVMVVNSRSGEEAPVAVSLKQPKGESTPPPQPAEAMAEAAMEPKPKMSKNKRKTKKISQGGSSGGFGR